jgi:hypothetical protein
MKLSIRRNSTIIDMDMTRRLNNYDVDRLIGVLTINEGELCHWMVQDSSTLVRNNLGGAVEYVKALREAIKTERPDYVSPYGAELSFSWS